MHVLVYDNPRAGRADRRRLHDAIALLSAAGWHVSSAAPLSAEELRQAGAHPPDVDAVILAGGDGTLSTYLQDFPASGPPIGLLPLGTANVVARDLGIPLQPVAAAEALLSAVPLLSDVGRVTGSGRLPRRFILSAGAGDVGASVAGVSGVAKRIAGGAAYGLSFMGTLLSGRSLTVELDGARLLAGSVIATVTRHYAGGFVPDPASRPGDGMLDVHILPPGPAAAAAFVFRASQRKARARRVHEVVIVTDSALECDGDHAGRSPCVISIDRPVQLLGLARPA